MLVTLRTDEQGRGDAIVMSTRTEERLTLTLLTT